MHTKPLANRQSSIRAQPGAQEITKQTAIQKAKKIRNVTIAGQIATGQSVTDVAAEHNISKVQTYRILQDDQCKDILDHVMRVNIAHAKGINKKFLQHCYSEDDKLSLDAIKQYQKNVGIAPSHATSLFIQNIYNDNRTLIPEDVGKLFGLLSGQAAGDEDVIDGELEPEVGRVKG